MLKILKLFIKLALLAAVVGAGFYVHQTYRNVKNVMQYEKSVDATLKAQGLEGDTKLALAIIYTETKGNAVDVMQSSESLNGNQNSISDEDKSIAQGVSNLCKVLEYAEDKKVDIWTGVQAYNFGQSYIDYVAKNGGKNNLELAEKYSRTVVAPSLGNTTNATYYHVTVDSLMNSGGKLYVNGGNMYYANEVKWHLMLLNLFNW